MNTLTIFNSVLTAKPKVEASNQQLLSCYEIELFRATTSPTAAYQTDLSKVEDRLIKRAFLLKKLSGALIDDALEQIFGIQGTGLISVSPLNLSDDVVGVFVSPIKETRKLAHIGA